MLAGLDVGGTHTDAVLLDAATGRRLASVKTATRPDDVLPGVLEALGALFSGGNDRSAPGRVPGHDARRDPATVRRLTVSTTLGLNALLTSRTDRAALLAVPGPGIDPRLFLGRDDPLFHVLPGAQDHRGRIIAAPDPAAVAETFVACRRHGAAALAIVSKFSPKNPELERALGESARAAFGPDLPVVLGASVSGSLNFPRRMHTAWCNAALARVNRSFLDALARAAMELGLDCPLAVLKADAGSFAFAEAAADPASCMGSGPAAGLLGVWALAGMSAANGDLLMLDVGGTSTDLALLAGGQPLLARRGLTVGGRPTHIRALWTRSIALGGDSSLRLADDSSRSPLSLVGPDRSGPALALASSPRERFERPPTLTDALNVLGLAAVGNREHSLAALARLAEDARCPGNACGDPALLARRFVDAALARIKDEADALLAEVNAQPVYTIRELLVEKPLAPREALCIGGPAGALASGLERALGIPVCVPGESPWANALGAALARPTRAAELYADTLAGRMSLPGFGLEKRIHSGYSLAEAKKDLLDAFASDAADAAAHAPQIVYAESFAMLDDAGRRGRTLRVRAQRAAGLLLAPDVLAKSAGRAQGGQA